MSPVMARTKPRLFPQISLHNINSGETVYQRAVLLIGETHPDLPDEAPDDDHITISIQDAGRAHTFPIQRWPVSQGQFKALVILSPGENLLTLHYDQNGVESRFQIELTYIPQLQTPPLHLAIMIAKDSPLLIDCPPAKLGAISSAHSDLDAAVNKFRMTAYMWQALTAEDMRAKGLGRRAFRLEEEWTAETLTRDFMQRPRGAAADQMRSTAKIHLIRSDKTTAELRNPNVAQQNERGRRRDDLHSYFEAALKKHGGPFTSSAHPIVAGLILDSTFDPESDLILGHAALGCSKPQGLSLGVFGSHLTYSWPRFLEEVSSSLLDIKIPGENVGNDNNECGTMWEACSIGQGAFLHEVGHAFGAPHTSGIMQRGYAQDWPKCFLSKTAYCAANDTEGITVISETENNATWDLADALSFKVLPHFRLPGDELLSLEARSAQPSVAVTFEESAEFLRLVISSPTDIARISFNGADEEGASIASPLASAQYTMKELETRFERSKPLVLDVLGMNGKSRTIGNVWRLFADVKFVRIPGCDFVLQKRSVKSDRLERVQGDEGRDYWDWTVLLNERGQDGKLKRATAIDSRVGCLLDGAVVYFEDGHKTPCGPRWGKGGAQHHFGGHAAQKFKIPAGVEITKVEVGCSEVLNGLRFHMSNGAHGGYLYDNSPKHILQPAENEKIIGFYGRSDWNDRGCCGVEEFGIITAPRNVELPEIVYDLEELQNTDGGTGSAGSADNDVDLDDDEHNEYYGDEVEEDDEDQDEDMED